MGQFNDYLRSRMDDHIKKQDDLLKSCLPKWIIYLAEKHPRIARPILSRVVKISSRQFGDIIEVKFFGMIVYIDPIYQKQKKELGIK